MRQTYKININISLLTKKITIKIIIKHYSEAKSIIITTVIDQNTNAVSLYRDTGSMKFNTDSQIPLQLVPIARAKLAILRKL